MFKFLKIGKILVKIQEYSFWLLKALSLIKEKSHALIIALELDYKYNNFPKYNHSTFLEKNNSQGWSCLLGKFSHSKKPDWIIEILSSTNFFYFFKEMNSYWKITDIFKITPAQFFYKLFTMVMISWEYYRCWDLI